MINSTPVMENRTGCDVSTVWSLPMPRTAMPRGLTELQITLHKVYHVRAVHSYRVTKSGLELNVERGAHACHEGCERE